MTEPFSYRRWQLIGWIVIMSFLFGNNFVALAVALRGSGPATVQAIAGSVAALTAFVVTRRDLVEPYSSALQTFRSAWVVGLALSVGSPMFIVLGVQRVSPGVVAMLTASTPIVTMVLERVFIGSRFGPGQLIGVALGLLGAGFVVSPFLGGVGTELAGVGFLAMGSLCWAAGLILTRILPGAGGGGRFVFWQLASALPVLFVLAWAWEGIAVVWSIPFVVAVVYSGAVSKGIASVIQFRIVRFSSPVHSSLSAFLVPAFGLISSYVILGEVVTPTQIAGGLVIVVGVGIVLGSRQGQPPVSDARLSGV